MRGWRCRAGRAPAEPEPQRLPAGLGSLRYKLVAKSGDGGGEERPVGVWLRAPAPLHVPARQRRRRPGLGEGSPGQQRLRVSLTLRGAPGAMVVTAAAAAAAQADNELASTPSRGRFGLGVHEATAVPSG